MRRQPARMFWFRLALALGMSKRRAQAEITSEEFTEWIAYSLLEPFGERQADFRSGILAMVMANAHRGRGTAPFKATDFMPDYAHHAASANPEQVKASLRAISVMCGGKIEDKRQ